jgi:hypothetical protein
MAGLSPSLPDTQILLGAIVIKSPGCKLARSALTLLDQSVVIYEEGSGLCRPAATVVRGSSSLTLFISLTGCHF